MTVHASKGLEFQYVFLIAVEEDLFPSFYAKQVEDKNGIEEERRLFYVAVTRAKEFLAISHVEERTQWGKTNRMRPSRFLREIPRTSATFKDLLPPKKFDTWD